MTRRTRERTSGPSPRPAATATLTPPPGLIAAVLPEDCGEFALIGWDVPSAIDLSPLTDAEREIVRLIAMDVPDQEIARRRNTSPRTIAKQVARALPKLGVQSRFELIAKLAAGR